MKKSLLPAILFLAAFPLFSQAPEYTLRISRSEAPVKLDGELDEACWQSAAVITDFRRQFRSIRAWPAPGRSCA